MHAESEHGLRVQLATALRERDMFQLCVKNREENAAKERESRDAEWRAVVKADRAALTAAESERDALRGENGRLRDVLKALLAFPGSNATDHEQCDEGCPYKRARDALAAPADGEEGKR